MVKNMCVKFGEDWTNSFQELDRKQSSGHTYGQGQPYMPPLCGGINRCYMCIQWTSVLYFIVITCQSNPPIQQTVWRIQQINLPHLCHIPWVNFWWRKALDEPMVTVLANDDSDQIPSMSTCKEKGYHGYSRIVIVQKNKMVRKDSPYIPV